MTDESQYTEEELAAMNQWFPLEHASLPKEFKFWFATLMSNSNEARELFMDPRSALNGRSESLLPALPGVDDDTLITTTIFGHERSLKLRMILAVAAVDSQENTVGLTSHKVKPTSS